MDSDTGLLRPYIAACRRGYLRLVTCNSRARRRWALGALSMIFGSNPLLHAAPALLLHTSGFEAPAPGKPDDLLMLAGYGFEPTDRVVYQAAPENRSPKSHPAAVPKQSTPTLGIAPVVQLGSPAYALTVRLPATIRPRQIYRLWVVNSAGEWSKPVTINDPRPLWVSPSYVNETLDFAALNRRIRIIGRNLEPDGAAAWIRLLGPSTYVFKSKPPLTDAVPVQDFVAEGALPPQLLPGHYSVAFSRDGHQWFEVPNQRLEVRPDPAALPRCDVADRAFGNCAPDDGADDTECLAKAIQAASSRGGIVVIPAGTWDFFPPRQSTEHGGDGFLLPPNVHLAGVGSRSSLVVRHGVRRSPLPGAMLTLLGRNSVRGLGFTDADQYETIQESRPVIQLGAAWLNGDGGNKRLVESVTADIVISDNSFLKVGRAVADSGQPLARLFITRNEFGAYDNALMLTGNRYGARPFRIDDSVVRWNRFVPGSYMDISARQGTVASQLGASRRGGFRSHSTHGTTTPAVQS